jgi:hypothetical protein
VTLIFVVAVIVVPCARAAAPGQLDPRFSGDGIAKVTHDDGSIPTAVAAAAGGAVYVAVTQRFAVLKIRPDGARDRHFGHAGAATVARDGVWDGNAEPEALAVRPSDGAVFLAGRTRGDLAIIAAFTRAGVPLPGFGVGGQVQIPLHGFGWGASQLLFEPSSGAITYAVSRAAFGAARPQGTPDLVLLQLTAGGAPDVSFGQGGAVHVGLADSPGYSGGQIALWRMANGELRAVTHGYSGANAFVGFDAHGQLAASFGQAGRSMLGGRVIGRPGRQVVPVGADLLVADAGTRAAGSATRVTRLADGGLGRARWTAMLGRRMPRPEDLIADREGGAYVAATATRGAGTKNYQRVIAVAHVKAGGVIDRRLGDNGVLDVHLRGHNRMISTPLLLLDHAHRRLWLVADAGSGFFDIREDYGGHNVLVAAIRTR